MTTNPTPDLDVATLAHVVEVLDRDGCCADRVRDLLHDTRSGRPDADETHRRPSTLTGTTPGHERTARDGLNRFSTDVTGNHTAVIPGETLARVEADVAMLRQRAAETEEGP